MRAAVCTAAVAAVALMVGCAGLTPGLHPPVARTPPAPATPGSTAATVDSAPSPEALVVLGTIPEPLRPEERVPAPTRMAASDSVPAIPDSGAAAPAETTHAEVPVPTLTTPLGERPGISGRALPESALVPRSPARPASGPSARPDTCWRLQIGAPPEKQKAEGLQSAASSQLLVPFVIEHEKSRYKVRSRDCMERSAASALRLRAERSGFHGAFTFRVVQKP